MIVHKTQGYDGENEKARDKPSVVGARCSGKLPSLEAILPCQAR